MIETIRFYICAALITAGLVFEITAVLGVFRFKNALNRMHAAALGDTMGLFFVLLGLSTASGMNMLTVKLLTLCVLFWMTSPVSSHMLARLELETNEHLDREVSLWTR